MCGNVIEVYRGAHDGDHKLVLGSVLPGSELAWLRVLVPRNAVLQRQTQQRSSHDMSCRGCGLARERAPMAVQACCSCANYRA